MPVSDLIQAMARAYFARERDRLGITARDQNAQKIAIAGQSAASEDLVRQAQIAKALQEMGFAPAEHQAQLEHIQAQTDALRNPKSAAVHYERDEAGNVTAVVPQRDGTFVKVPVGDIGTARRDPTEKAPPVGAPVQIVGPDGKPALYFPTKSAGVVSLPEGSAFATDVRNERKAAVTAVQPLTNVETLANQAEAALNDFEDTNGLMHPINKGVSHLTYKNLLNALAVPWGRLLGDTRISDQDRTSYARSVGEPSLFLREMAPNVARQRLNNLRAVIADIRSKYGDVLDNTSGMLAPVGGGADLLGRRQPSATEPPKSGGIRLLSVEDKH